MKPRTLITCCILCLMAYLSFIFPLSIFADHEEEHICGKSRILGKEAAKEEHKSWGAFGLGLVAGIIPLFGTLMMLPIVYASTNPQPSYVPNKEAINEMCYLEGYKEVARNQNMSAVIGGGLFSFFIWSIIAASWGQAFELNDNE